MQSQYHFWPWPMTHQWWDKSSLIKQKRRRKKNTHRFSQQMSKMKREKINGIQICLPNTINIFVRHSRGHVWKMRKWRITDAISVWNVPSRTILSGQQLVLLHFVNNYIQNIFGAPVIQLISLLNAIYLFDFIFGTFKLKHLTQMTTFT